MTMTTRTTELNIAPLLLAAAAHRGHAELTGQLHPDVWAALRATGIGASCLPPAFGGRPVPVPDLVAAIVEIAQVDAAAGWAAAILGPAGIFTSLLCPAIADQGLPGAPPGELFVGGASQPAGTAQQEPGGYRLTGTWPLVSGAHQLSLAFLAARVLSTQGTEEGVRWWCVPGTALTVHDDWDAHGLRGSDSASVTVTDLLLPYTHSVDLTAPAVIDGGPLARFPRYGLLACCLAAVALGIGRHAQQLFHDLAVGERPGGRMADSPAVRAVTADTAGRLNAAAGYLTSTVTRAWTAALAGCVSGEQQTHLRLAAVEATRAAADTTRVLFTAAGSAAVYRTTGLGDRLRDIDVVARHALLSTPSAQRAGAYLFTGQPPKDL